MRVRYSKRATRDLISIADYITARDPSAAEAVETRIRTATSRLGFFPFSGRETDDPSIRVLPVARYPYLIFYEVLEKAVVIHHIRDARRKPFHPA